MKYWTFGLVVLLATEAWVSIGLSGYGTAISEDKLVTVVVGQEVTRDLGADGNKKYGKQYEKIRDENLRLAQQILSSLSTTLEDVKRKNKNNLLPFDHLIEQSVSSNSWDEATLKNYHASGKECLVNFVLDTDISVRLVFKKVPDQSSLEVLQKQFVIKYSESQTSNQKAIDDVSQIEVLREAEEKNKVEKYILQRSRTVRDMASFFIDDYKFNGQPLWAAVTIFADPSSGSGTIPGAYIDGSNGNLVDAGPMTLIQRGSWKRISSSDTSFPSTGKYDWNEKDQLDARPRGINIDGRYSPFSYGGTIIFKPNLGGKDRDQFQNLRIIFPEWISMVSPMIALGATDQNVSKKETFVGEKKISEIILDQSNLLMSFSVFRESLQTNLITSRMVDDLLDNKDLNAVSVYVHLLISRSSENQKGMWTKQIVKKIECTNDANYMLSVAIGAFSVMVFENKRNDEIQAVLAEITKRLRHLKFSLSEFPELNYILVRSGQIRG